MLVLETNKWADFCGGSPDNGHSYQSDVGQKSVKGMKGMEIAFQSVYRRGFMSPFQGFFVLRNRNRQLTQPAKLRRPSGPERHATRSERPQPNPLPKGEGTKWVGLRLTFVTLQAEDQLS